jgi:hypothetical protein
MGSIYRITQLGESTRGGMNAALDAEISALAKSNEWSAYTIANEIVAARVGQTLGLPVPAGVIAEDHEKRLYYLSLDVSREGKRLPPILPEKFVSEEPRIAAGIAVFDALIANGDRNASNLSRDLGFTPPRVTVFDHGHALFGTDEPVGPDRIDLATDRLGCAEDSTCIARDSVLLDQPLDPGLMDHWMHRAASIPQYVFHDVCGEVASMAGLGVSPEEARRLAKWLARRAASIDQLIWDNRASFPAVRWGLWGPKGQPA